MAGSIFDALNNSSDKNGKFGFVVTTMQQTLESLQIIQQSMNQKPMAGGLTTYSMGTDGVTPVYNPGSLVGGDPAHATALVNSTIGGKLDGSGYVVNGYSAQAELIGYGALDYSDDLEINGELKSCFTIVSPQIGSQQMQQGIDCTGVVKMLPNKDKFNPDVIKTLEKFQYGLAVDVEKFVVPFFKRYFGKIDWTKDKIISLMSKRLLYAYITSDGFDGFLPVTVDYQQAIGTPFKIFLPHQWLISTDNGVSIKAKINGEDKILSSDNCLYLTESDGTLVSTPSTLCEEMQQKEYVESEYVSTNFRTKTGLVRFYLYDLGQVEKEIIGEVPEEYEQSLVDNSIIDSNPMPLNDGSGAMGSKNDSAFYAEGQVDWVAFRKKHPNLPQGHEEIIEQIAKQYNINTRMWMTQMGLETGWFKSKNFKTRKNPGGISASSKYKGGEVYTLSYLGGVRAKRAIEVRGEGYGHYWIFETFEDGYRAMAHLLVNSSRYGLGKFGARTVYEHFTNMYKGGYCDLREAVCQNYNDKLMNQYINII